MKLKCILKGEVLNLLMLVIIICKCDNGDDDDDDPQLYRVHV